MKIPSDDALPFEEVTLDVPLSKPGDVLPDAVKSYFIGGGDIDVNLAKRAATKQLVEEFASKSQNLGASLAKETAMGSTETFALVRPVEKTGGKACTYIWTKLVYSKGRRRTRERRRWRSRADFQGRRFTGTYSLARCKRNRNLCVR